MMESTPSMGACGQSQGRCDIRRQWRTASGGAGTRLASAGVVRTNESGWAGAGHWAVRWAVRGHAEKAVGPLCARIRVGWGLETRQAGQAKVRCVSWARRPFNFSQLFPNYKSIGIQVKFEFRTGLVIK
jgi:hypothetical protein